MTSRQAFLSALHLFVVFAFFAAGLLFVALPYLPLTRMHLVHLFATEFETCTEIGLGFFLASLLFLLGFYALNRGRYLVIRMGIAIDLDIVRQTIEEHLSHHFPKRVMVHELLLGPQAHLELRVRLAPQVPTDREALLVAVEKELIELLQKRFGYAKSLLLILEGV